MEIAVKFYYSRTSGTSQNSTYLCPSSTLSHFTSYGFQGLRKKPKTFAQQTAIFFSVTTQRKRFGKSKNEFVLSYIELKCGFEDIADWHQILIVPFFYIASFQFPHSRFGISAVWFRAKPPRNFCFWDQSLLDYVLVSANLLQSFHWTSNSVE